MILFVFSTNPRVAIIGRSSFTAVNFQSCYPTFSIILTLTINNHCECIFRVDKRTTRTRARVSYFYGVRIVSFLKITARKIRRKPVCSPGVRRSDLTDAGFAETSNAANRKIYNFRPIDLYP